MKALLLALFISTNALAAIPLNGDDERAVANPRSTKNIAKQTRSIEQITKKMNMLLLKYAQTSATNYEIGYYLDDLATEVRYLSEFKEGELDEVYLKNIEEDINTVGRELNELK